MPAFPFELIFKKQWSSLFLQVLRALDTIFVKDCPKIMLLVVAYPRSPITIQSPIPTCYVKNNSTIMIQYAPKSWTCQFWQLRGVASESKWQHHCIDSLGAGEWNNMTNFSTDGCRNPQKIGIFQFLVFEDNYLEPKQVLLVRVCVYFKSNLKNLTLFQVQIFMWYSKTLTKSS